MRDADVRVRINFILTLLCIPVVGLGGAKLALAQDAPIETTARTSSADYPLEVLLDMQLEVASTRATDIFSTPSTATVLDHDFIQAFSYMSLAEALKTLPGVTVDRTTSRNQQVTIRGIHSGFYDNKVLLLINGVPTWNPVTGEMSPLGRISMNDVERIEILKGPASVLYGSNAFSGAINVILKRSTNKDADVGSAWAGVGLNQVIMPGGNYLYSSGDLSVFVAANAYSEQGDARVSDQETDGVGKYYDFINSRNFNLNLKYKQHSLLFNTYWEEQQRQEETDWADGYANPQPFNGYLANYTFESMLTGNFLLKAGVTYDYNERLFVQTSGGLLLYPADPTVPTAKSVKGQRFGAFARGSWDIVEQVNLELGVDAEYRQSIAYRDFSPTIGIGPGFLDYNLSNKSLQEYSGYGNLDLKFSPLDFVIGARFTHNESFGNNLAARGTAVYRLSQYSSLKLIAVQSYRAPSLFETHFAPQPPSVPVGDGPWGVPNLLPETSNSYEVSYLAAFENLFLQATAYYATYSNFIYELYADSIIRPDNGMIQGQDPTNPLSVYGNNKTFSAKGFELETRYVDTHFTAFLNGALVFGDKGDLVHTGVDDTWNFKYIPVVTGSVGATARLGDFGASAVIRGWGPTLSIAGNVSGYMVGDLNLTYHQPSVARHLITHTLAFKNITDTATRIPDYVERTKTSMPFESGRRVMYVMTFAAL